MDPTEKKGVEGKGRKRKRHTEMGGGYSHILKKKLYLRPCTYLMLFYYLHVSLFFFFFGTLGTSQMCVCMCMCMPMSYVYCICKSNEQTKSKLHEYIHLSVVPLPGGAGPRSS